MDLSNIIPFCIADAVAKGHIPFRLNRVDELVRHINDTCPWDTLRPGILPLEVFPNLTTGEVPLVATATGWTPYLPMDVFGRLLDYKLPLVVLLLQAPHSTLGFRLGGFSRLHLFANPADTLGSYLFTLAECYGILLDVRDAMAKGVARCQRLNGGDASVHLPDEEGARALALILITYATEGRPVSNMDDLVDLYLAHPDPFRKAARSLAADRSTSLVPMMAALSGFVAAIALKYGFIDHDTYDADNPQAIQLWSLSSSMTVMWSIVAVELAGIIGAHQSADSAANMLSQLEDDLVAQPAAKLCTNLSSACRLCRAHSQPGGTRVAVTDALHRLLTGAQPPADPLNQAGDAPPSLPNDTENQATAPRRRMETRITNGVMANYRPGRWARYHRVWVLDVVAMGIVMMGSAGGTLLAWRVPPEGFNCRAINKVCMFGLYFVGGVVQWVINALPERRLSVWGKVRATTVLDTVVLVGFAANVFVSQFGVFNCPECYAVEMASGEWGVLLPSVAWETVKKRLAVEYPGVLFGFLALQFFIAAVFWFTWSTTRHMLIGESEARKWAREKWALVRGRGQVRQAIELRQLLPQ
ncbi:hypothetical protein C8A05DRAFT_36481 [Staphylotrichum tortipilum]|uniref:Uncharacterized protein n=1 Tax=Staphylotrichum tortipilum TaxID=2831512 RepID=A0AAN6MGU5_9PEZI|nr:hypothetical protein C8A05DRAFT_36481 [Staphylotrichum longicolle]